MKHWLKEGLRATWYVGWRTVALLLIVLAVFHLSGCAKVGAVKTSVKGTVNIDCGAEPVIDALILLPADPIGKVEGEDTPWVVFTPEHYENLAENMVRIESRFDQDATVIRQYRVCIENFNTPPATP